MYIQILIRYYWRGPKTEPAFVGPFPNREEAERWREGYRPLRGELSYKDRPTNNSVFGPDTSQITLHNYVWTAIHAVCQAS